MAKVKRKYEVYEVPEDERTPRRVVKLMAPSDAKKRKKDGKRRSGFDSVEVPDKRPQYDVYFPSGHSLRVIGEDELLRLGFHVGAGLVDMETGEDIADTEPVSLREQVGRATQGPRLQS